MNQPSNVSTCPTETKLRRYLDDQLDDFAANLIEEHVEKCDECELRIKRLLDASAFLDIDSPVSNQDLESSPILSGYTCGKDDVIGTGGFGVVWKMRDTRFNRDVAVKVMRFRDSKKSSLVRRFLSEAQICSQLSHPYIVPVYDMGTLEDGRAFYVMKLVDGTRLDDHFSQPGSQTMARVQVFQHICQAVGYAHSKNVVHRDLKPQNIMVGEHGEIQVMDWGLAKVVSEAGDAGSAEVDQQSVFETVRLDVDQTVAGAIGTYPYMPPEQARDAATADFRSDVFSLGAILCELLTGKPPYTGHDLATVKNQAITGELDDAKERLQQCGADQRIVGVALRCLEPNSDHRSDHAGIVADDVSRFITGVEEDFQRERIEKERQLQVAIESRKRRRIRVFLILALLLLVTGTFFTSSYYYLDQKGKLAHALQLIDQAKLQINSGQFENAIENLELSRQISGRPNSYNDLVRDAELCLRLRKIKETLHLAPLTGPNDGLRENTAEASISLAIKGYEANLGTVIAQDKVGKYRQSPAKQWIVAGLNSWAFIEYFKSNSNKKRTGEILSFVKRLDENDNTKQIVYSMANWEQPEVLVAAISQNKDETSIAVNRLGLDFAAHLKTTSAQSKGSKIASRFPNDFLTNYRWGAHLAATGSGAERSTDAVRFCQAAVALRPNDASAHINLGTLLADLGQLSDAVNHLSKALRIEPENPTAHNNLGTVYRDMFLPAEAIEHFKHAIQFNKKKAYVLPYVNLAKIYSRTNQTKLAEQTFRKAIERSPKDFNTHYAFGLYWYEIGELEKAIASYQTAISINANHSESLNNLGNTEVSIAGYLKSQGKWIEAEHYVTEAKTHFERAIQADPLNGMACMNLGNNHNEVGEYDIAIELFLKAYDVGLRDQRLVFNLANTMLNSRRYTEAVFWIRRLSVEEQRQPKAQLVLGRALCRAGNFTDGVLVLEKLVETYPNTTEANQASSSIEFFQTLLDLEQKHSVSKSLTQLSDKHELARMADLYYHKQMHQASALLWRSAFEYSPELLEDPGFLIVASRYAAKAAESVSLDQKLVCLKLAYNWLELSSSKISLRNVAERLAFAERVMREPEFDLIRDSQYLDFLSDSEQQKWRELWVKFELLRKPDN